MYQKIDKLLMEANEKIAKEVSKVRGGDLITPIPIIGGPGVIHAGYTAGREMGHPRVGLFLGSEGAAGAKSKYDQTISIGDVYTRKNILKRGLQGGLGMTAYSMMNELDDPSYKAQMILNMGLGSATVLPGLKYGLGKLFGKKRKGNLNEK